MARPRKSFSPKMLKQLTQLKARVKYLTSQLESLQHLVLQEEKEMQQVAKDRVKRAVQTALTRYKSTMGDTVRGRGHDDGFSLSTPRRRGRAGGWSEIDVRRLHENLKAGKSVAEVALLLDRKPAAVRQRIFQEGISLRALKKELPPAVRQTAAAPIFGKRKRAVVHEVKPWTPDEFREVLGLLNSGMPLKEVSEKIGRPFRQVRQKLEIEGAPIEAIRKEAQETREDGEDFFEAEDLASLARKGVPLPQRVPEVSGPF